MAALAARRGRGLVVVVDQDAPTSDEPGTPGSARIKAQLGRREVQEAPSPVRQQAVEVRAARERARKTEQRPPGGGGGARSRPGSGAGSRRQPRGHNVPSPLALHSGASTPVGGGSTPRAGTPVAGAPVPNAKSRIRGQMLAEKDARKQERRRKREEQRVRSNHVPTPAELAQQAEARAKREAAEAAAEAERQQAEARAKREAAEAAAALPANLAEQEWLKKDKTFALLKGSTALKIVIQLGVLTAELKLLHKQFRSKAKRGSDEMSVLQLYSLLDARDSPFTRFLVELKGVDGSSRRGLCFPGFVQIVLTYGLYSPDEVLAFCFRCFDSDSSGFIDEAEYAAMLDGIAEATRDAGPPMLARLLHDFDKDGDGRISFNEFRELNARYPLVMFPAYQLQDTIRRVCINAKGWARLTSAKGSLGVRRPGGGASAAPAAAAEGGAGGGGRCAIQ